MFGCFFMKLGKFLIPLICVIITAWVIAVFIYPTFNQENIIVVPNIVGLDEDEAKEILDDTKANYKIIYEESLIDDKKVSRSVPKEGSVVNQNQRILVYVNHIPEYEIQSYEGMLYEDVSLILSKFDIKINVTKVLDNRCEPNTVLDQYPKEGKISEVKELNLTISFIDETVLMPYFVGKTLNEALAFTKKYGFKIETIFINSIYERYTILYQEIEASTKLYINSGHKLLFYIAK